MSKLLPHEDPARRCLKVHEWPEADQQAWHSLFEPGDLLDGTQGNGFHWREPTRDKHRKGYGRWLCFLIMQGLMVDDQAPSDRVTPDNVIAYLKRLHEDGIADWTICGRIFELFSVIRAIAPDTDWDWLHQIYKSLEANSKDRKNKFPRLRPAAEISAWAYQHMDHILSDPPLRDAETKFRDGLQIALLISCPTMRLRNLTMIEIDQHLRRLEHSFQLHFSAEETKTSKPLAIPVPESLSEYIDHYIKAVRPALAQGASSKRLWMTRYGEPMNDKAIYLRITTVTKKAFGAPINPHLFRDCAVTTVAIDDPSHIGIAAPLLGHTDPRTTEKHYIQANSLAAGRRLRHSIDQMRKDLRSIPTYIRKQQ